MTVVRMAAILLALEAVSLTANEEPALQYWIANPLLKVKPADPAPSSPARAVRLYAARNEFESFQIVLRAAVEDMAGVDVEVSGLKGGKGSEIPASQVMVYAEGFMDLAKPSSAEGGTGEWPDPLIPRTDRYTNERRNAFPLTLQRGRNQPVWVEVYVPEGTAPGDYKGQVRISQRGMVDATVPLRLTVWAFSLPSTASLKTSFGLSGPTLLKQHRGHYTSDEDLYTLTRLYTKAALLHRLTTHGGSMVPPRYHSDGRQTELDWAAYDAEVGPFLSGTVMAKGEPLEGAQATTVDLRTPGKFDNEEQRAAYIAAAVKHFEQRGWIDKVFLYLWDEPQAADLPKVAERGRTVLKAAPALRMLLTIPYRQNLRDVVKIWVPLVNCLEPRPGFDDYCEGVQPFAAYGQEIAAGKSLWFYQSCASHGCNGRGGTYFAGWPSYMIDASGPANRVMQWVAWKYHIQGELYYSMNQAYSDRDPWTDMRIAGGNGDGTLFYPGKPSRIGGHSDIPIESIRLKLIRDGMEDYEYLALLARLQGEKAAAEYAARIVQEPYQWEARPEAFLKVRQDLGCTLDRLSRSLAGQGSDGK